MGPIHRSCMVGPFAAGLLLAAGAVAAAEDDDARPAAPAPGKAASVRIVKFFATVQDKSGQVDENPQVMIQSETSSTMGVGSGGAKLSLSATKPSALTLLTPGSHCNITFDPAKSKADAFTVVMKKKDDGIDCMLAAQSDPPK